MANVKISQLPAAVSLIPNADVAPIVHAGTTYKATPNQIVQAVLPSPGPIGSSTPSTAVFTTLTATGTTTLATTLTGLLKATSGVVSVAVANTDYLPATTGSAIQKANGSGGLTNAVSGTDYAPATSGTSILYGNGSGGFSNVTVGSGLSFAGGILTSLAAGGTVTTVSVVSANGFAGTVANASSTPALTLSTTVTGLLKGNGTAISAASSSTDYVAPGANSNITSMSGITGAITTPTYIDFNTGATVTSAIGRMYWDGGTTLNLGMTSNVTQAVGESQYFYVKASAAVSKGDLCMFSGVVGASGVITVAPATGIVSGQYIVGLAAENIALNGFGLIQGFGTLRGFDTTGSSVGETWADGDILYYNSAYAGGMTKTYPASGPIVTIAAVIHAATSGSGSVTVRPSVTQRVTATAPLASSQALSGTALSISQASGSTNGYLSSTDWTTFNSKAPATSGTSILYGNGSGGFSNVTVGSGLTFVGGTLASVSGGGGTVTSVSVVSANGFAGTVATASTTPAITLSTSVTGLLKGNGTAIAAATAGTDYLAPPSGTAILKANSGGALANAVSGTDYAPATVGSSILYGNGAGGFSNVTIGSNLTFVGGTLSATGGSMVYPGAGIAVSTGSAWGTSKATPTGDVVGTSDTQTLTNKTLTNPVINGFTGDTSVINIGSGQIYKDASGNVGIGVTPNAWRTDVSFKAIQMPGGSFTAYMAGGLDQTPGVVANGYVDSGGTWRYINSRAASWYIQNGGMHAWYTAPSGTAGNAITFTQAMTLDASGNLLVGTTSQLGAGKFCSLYDQSTTVGIVCKNANASNTGYHIQFLNSSGADQGRISQTNSTTIAYVTSSDQRLKENIVDAPSALDSVNAIKVRSFDWKSDGSHVDYGYIAQELLEVVPEAVDIPLSPAEMIGVDFGKLTPRLVKAIQELSAELNELKAKVNA